MRASHQRSQVRSLFLGNFILIAFYALLQPGQLLMAQPAPDPNTPKPLIEAPPPPVDPNSGNAELAWRVSDMAQNIIRSNKSMVPAHWALAGNLLDAAARLDPKEERYPRLAIDAYLQARDIDATVDAMKRYYSLDPYDQGAQIQRIEMYISLQQSADQRLAYLKRLLQMQLAPEVRSFAAATAAQIAAERGDKSEAEALVQLAMKLNPFNLQALRLRYGQILNESSSTERMHLLLAMLRANPAQVSVMNFVAQLLATNGLPDESATFYNTAIELSIRSGLGVDYLVALDAASENAISGQMDNARNIVNSIVGRDPFNYQALLLKAMLERAAGPSQDEVRARTQQQLLNSCYNRVIEIRRHMGAMGATTRESTDATPPTWGDLESDIRSLNAQAHPATLPVDTEPSGSSNRNVPATNPMLPVVDSATVTTPTSALDDVQPSATAPSTTAMTAPSPVATTAPSTALVAEPNSASALSEAELKQRQDLLAQYVDAVEDAAWIYLYFVGKADAAAPLVDVLKFGVPENDETRARLEGWLYLVRGEKLQAKQKLSAIADRDPLSELGIIRLENEARGTRPDPAIRERAQKLADKHPASQLGVTLWEAFRALDLRPQPNGTEAAALRKEFEQFPQSWIRIIDQPQLFYTVTVDPLKIPHKFGEPMLARLTIENISDFDISIGGDGVLHPEALFNVQIHGRGLVNLPGVAVERISRRLILKARPGPLQPGTAPPVGVNPPESSISFTVRLDAGVLQEVMNADPVPAIQLNFDVLINPISPTTFGAAGARVPFTRIMERSATPMNNFQQTLNGIGAMNADDRLHVLDLCNDLFMVSSRDPHMQQALPTLFSVIRAETEDKYPFVRAWASNLTLGLLPDQLKQRQAEGALNDPLWIKRLLTMMKTLGLPLDWQRKQYSALAANDSDPTVRRTAQSLLDLVTLIMAQISATRPTTTTAPAIPSITLPGIEPTTIPVGSAATEPTTEPVTQPVIEPGTAPTSMPGIDSLMPTTLPVGSNEAPKATTAPFATSEPAGTGSPTTEPARSVTQPTEPATTPASMPNIDLPVPLGDPATMPSTSATLPSTAP